MSKSRGDWLIECAGCHDEVPIRLTVIQYDGQVVCRKCLLHEPASQKPDIILDDPTPKVRQATNKIPETFIDLSRTWSELEVPWGQVSQAWGEWENDVLTDFSDLRTGD